MIRGYMIDDSIFHDISHLLVVPNRGGMPNLEWYMYLWMHKHPDGKVEIARPKMEENK